MWLKRSLFTVLSLVSVAALTVFAALAYTQARSGVTPEPAAQPAANIAGLASSLSYFFLPAEAFTPDAVYPNAKRQTTGCVNLAPPNAPFSAPVYLPQGSQVVSMTLFTYNSAITTTLSTAYLFSNDGLGGYTSSLLVDSLPNNNDFQVVTSTVDAPYTVDHQTAGLFVQWLTHGTGSVPVSLGLCGVRLAYYAPTGVTFLPLLSKPN